MRLILFCYMTMFLAACAGSHMAAPAYFLAENSPYLLDSGDRLRITVFGQENLSGTYNVDAEGYISMPLIEAVPARGATVEHLSQNISARLRNGFIREPNVTVEVETYRPFFILGEVNAAGQYPYAAGLTIESAVAIGGGFTPRAQRGYADVTRRFGAEEVRATVPVTTPIRPGDTITIRERWF